MRIEIIQISDTGDWKVRIGLLEKTFPTSDAAVEWLEVKMMEADRSWIDSIQNTSGT